MLLCTVTFYDLNMCVSQQTHSLSNRHSVWKCFWDQENIFVVFFTLDLWTETFCNMG